MKELKFYKKFELNSDTMSLFNIPEIKLVDGKPEMWVLAVLNRHENTTKSKRYIVSSYGRLYDLRNGRLITPFDSTMYKSRVAPYKEVTISTKENKYKKSAKYLVHRIVMFSFVKPDADKPIVNHKDGNPNNNYLWNLEWSNASENYIHALKTGLKIEKRGEERNNSLWSNSEIRVICAMIEDGHKATYIYNALIDILDNDPRVKYERIRTLYKHIIHKTHWAHISKEFDIDFSSHNFLKEKGSVKKKLDSKSDKLNKI